MYLLTKAVSMKLVSQFVNFWQVLIDMFYRNRLVLQVENAYE